MLLPEILRSKRRKLGFTLIELLIVIAIILILISIALPNFLEARMRAQVTKAKGEIGSIRTAFEMYMADFRIHPRGCITGYDNGKDRCQDNWGFVASSLTTPIKYMKQISDDLFAVNYSVLGSTGNSPPGHPWVKYRTARRLVWNVSNPNEAPKAIIPKDKQSPMWTNFVRINPSQYKSRHYIISSLGPDHDEDMIPFYAPMASGYKPGDEIYSPTNGTVSGGDLAFVGP